jgi:RsiW-degrading membrane proteinase PrsW (M82 family)
VTSLTIKRSLRRILPVISWIALSISVLTLVVSAPRLIEQGGGAGVVLGNLAQYGWTIALLFVVFARTRTIGWRALVGAALAGFFGVASLAVLIGKPLVARLGERSPFVMLVFAPVTEVLLELMPVALVLLLSVRSRRWRLSVGDAVLFGVTVASGFAIYEHILYSRGTEGGWFATLPFSLLLPFLSTHGSMLVGGHVVYNGLASLGLGVAIVYGKRFRLARWAFPVTLAVGILEHMTVNRVALAGMFDDLPFWTRVALIVTFNGHLSMLLFVAGVAAVAVFESRLVGRGGASLPAALRLRDVVASLRKSPRLPALAQLSRRLRYESMRRSAIFGAAQTCVVLPDADAAATVQRFHDKTGLPIGAAA